MNHAGPIRASLLALAVCGLLAPSLQALDLDLGEMEAAVYSLPNVRAQVKIGIEEDSFVVSEFADPVLAFPWKQLDHSSGVNSTSQVTVRLWEDGSFPLGEAPVWKELLDKTVVLDNRSRLRGTATFDRKGRIRVPVEMHRDSPVRRLKLELISKVDSPFFTEIANDSRAFYLTMRPSWKSREHHHPALMQVMAMTYNRKRAAWRWKAFLRQVTLASRSLKDARRFTSQEVSRMLKEIGVLAERILDEGELEQVAEDLLAESGKATGRMRDGVDIASRRLLGAKRLAFTSMQASQEAWKGGMEALAHTSSARNFVVGFKDSSLGLGARGALDKALYHLDRQLEALGHLWYISSDAELALLFSRLEENLRLEDLELVELGKRLEEELGRNYEFHNWGPIKDSPLYLKRFPENTRDREANAQLLRSMWKGLYYLIRSEHFHIQVLAEATRQAREGFELNAPKVSIQPAFEDQTLPPYLQVTVSLTGATIAPGKLARYPMTVRNLDTSPRQVSLREVGPLPSGWFSSFSEQDFTLTPGEAKTVTYSLTSPFYLQEAMQVTSSVRIHFDDEPTRYHEPTFVTLSTLGHELPTLANAESHLDIEVQEEELNMHAGEVSRFSYLVTHQGPTKKLVTCELLSRPPEGWIAILDPERLWLEPGEQARVNLRITAPLYMKNADRQEWVVGIAYSDEFKNKERIAFTTLATNLEVDKSDPRVNGDQVRTYFVTPGSSVNHSLSVENRGNVQDTFDFFLEVPPDGWYMRLEKPYVALPEFSEPIEIPFRVQAPAGAKAGDFVEVALTTVSSTHPEIRTQSKIRLAIVADPHLKLVPEGAPYAAAPGDEVTFTLAAENNGHGAMKLGFRASQGNVHPDWMILEADVQPIEAGEIRRITGRIRLPEGVEIGDAIPFEIAAVNELGEEVANVSFPVQVTRRHRVDLVLDNTRTLTSRGLVAVKLIVTNQGTVPDMIQILLSGLKRSYWARLSHNRVALAPNESKEFTLFIRIPPRADPGQDAVVQVQAKSARDSQARSFVSVTVEPNERRSLSGTR
jgi:uncharacterized membrane protein